jgi:calcineurin-like phosphoesterase family protein
MDKLNEMKNAENVNSKEMYCTERAKTLAYYKSISIDAARNLAEKEWDKKHNKQSRQIPFKVFFIGDPHFGHLNILKYDNRPFSSVAEMDAELIRRWNEVVSDEDMVIILGDVSWYDDEKTAAILKQLKGRKVLVAGNHDRLGPLTKAEFHQVHNSYLEIRDYETGKQLVLSHYPIHLYNGQRRGAIMLYAHVHNGLDEDVTQELAAIARERLGINFTMINAGCMYWDYKPVTLKEMLDKI